ncbi:hypothetical protein U9M48_034111 [Paspalum notatum var. saurae]|uniref:Uncharacterized protein n=1 Tax=Paspalum notatum var. saurae TaxID=547442 RepID=A0AAQ3X6I9_PASNO
MGVPLALPVTAAPPRAAPSPTVPPRLPCLPCFTAPLVAPPAPPPVDPRLLPSPPGLLPGAAPHAVARPRFPPASAAARLPAPRCCRPCSLGGPCTAVPSRLSKAPRRPCLHVCRLP